MSYKITDQMYVDIDTVLLEEPVTVDRVNTRVYRFFSRCPFPSVAPLRRPNGLVKKAMASWRGEVGVVNDIAAHRY